MKKTALLLVIALTLALMPHTALAATSGKCGDNLYWSFNSSTKTLTLTGSGAMYDYSFKTAPWYENRYIYHVNIPDGVTYIGNYAFSYIGLRSAVIPDSVLEMGRYAFYQNGALRDVTLSKSLTRIPESCFEYCESLQIDAFPEGLQYVDDGAFHMCRLMEFKELPEGLVRIGTGAFYNCYAFQSVNIPSTVEIISGLAFNYCPNITEIELPEGLDYLGIGALRATGISTITIPASVTRMPGNPFGRCPDLEEIHVAEGCPSCKVEEGVLYNATGETLYCYPACREGTAFRVPDTVNSIDEYAFSHLSMLNQLDIPEGVTTIGYNAFMDATSLTRLTVPASVTDIGENLFGTTMDVSNITVRLYAGSAMETYLNNNPSATNSYVSRGIQIEYLSRRDNAEFVLPEDVTVIGEAAFEHIDAVSVNIPDGAASIGDRAFADCQSLEWIWIPESVTDISATAFSGDTLTIYGVSGSAAETFALGAGIPFVAEN